jgi:hypothetical protein
MTKFNLNNLIDLALERSTGAIEIELAGQTLTVCSADMLPQRNRLLLAQSQAESQEYYSAVIQEQSAIEEKLKDQSLSMSQRLSLQKESKEVSVKIALKMFGASESLLSANVTYIEAMAQLNQGQLLEMIDDAIDGRVSGDRKDSMVCLIVAQTTNLIRSAMDDLEKNYQAAILERVKEMPKTPIVVPMMPEELINGKELNPVSVAA